MKADDSPTTLVESELTRKVIGAFYDTYNDLGPGFPEVVTRRALVMVLRQAGLSVLEEVCLPVWFRGYLIANFRADIVVAEKLILEVKVGAEITAYHRAQLLHYLKASDLEVGLVVNFGRVPQFSRVVYENSRKHRYFEPPDDRTVDGTAKPDDVGKNPRP